MGKVQPDLFTPVWKRNMWLFLPSWDAGYLVAAEGKVYFFYQNYKKRLQWDTLFVADKKDIRTKWAGQNYTVRMTIGEETYMIAFYHPSNAPTHKPETDWGDITNNITNIATLEGVPLALGLLVIPTSILNIVSAVKNLKEARKNGKAWRDYLEG